MKNMKFVCVGVVVAVVFWLFDSSVHYFLFNEESFEFIPSDFNELWMRATVAVLIILFGLFADYHSRKLLRCQKKLETTEIYDSMIHASHHILNNLLNQMQLLKIEAMKSKDFDKNIIQYFDDSIDEASDLLDRLSKVEVLTKENIWASVSPEEAGFIPATVLVDSEKSKNID